MASTVIPMNDGRRGRYTACLLIAGLACLCSSVLGCIGILAATWMQYSAIHLLPHVLLLLEVPLLALAMLLSRRFITVLWAIALVYPSAILFDHPDTTKSTLMLFPGIGTFATLVVATLLQFCPRLIALSPDSKIHGAKYASKG